MGEILVFKVDVGDEFSVINCRPVHARLMEEASRHDGVAIDMSRVRYVDSSGINMLLSITKAKPDRVAVFGLNEQPREVLDATGILKRINAFGSEEEAVNALAR